MDLHERDRHALDQLVRDLRESHGDALLACALTGEAASAGYIPQRSPLTTAVVLDEVTPEALRRTRALVREWRRNRLALPLLLDPRTIESSRDVFPLEFLELRQHHVLLYGERDPFADLEIELGHLRLQVEEQLRGKLLHLWEAFLETEGDSREMRRLLLETPPAFEMPLRGALHLLAVRAGEGGASVDGPDAFLAEVETRLAVPLPVLRRLEAVRRGEDALENAELEDCFDGYLREVRALVRATDGL